MKCNKAHANNHGIVIQHLIISGGNNHFVIGDDRNILVDRINDTIMESDLPPEAKVKVYNLIQKASKHNELEMED